MPQTILMFQFGDLGDTILTVPAIRAVRNRYPGARLVVLGKSVAADLLLRLGVVDDAIIVDKHLFDRPSSVLQPRALLSLAGVLRRLRQEGADTVILFHHLLSRWGTWKLALLAMATGAKRRVGLARGGAWFLTDVVHDRGFGARHEAEYWMDIAALVGATGELRLEVPIAAEDRAEASTLLGELPAGTRLLAIHPGTGAYGPGRRWPPERFAAAARLVLESDDMTCLLVGTDVDAEAARQVAAGLDGRAINLVGGTSVGELAAILERCAVVLANDGGVAHLAAAVGTPVVAVFGPSNDRAWRPLGSRVVSVDLPCRPCFYRDLETGLPNGCATRECLELVIPEMVAQHVLAAVRERALVP